MAKGQTYYDALGVSCDVTPAQLRAAYVRLMKKHHPDALSTASQGDANLAPLLNRSYAVLRNRTSRAWYDAQLAREIAEREAHPTRRAEPAALIAYKGNDRDRSRLTWALIALGIAVAIFQIREIWEDRFPAAGANAIAAPAADYRRMPIPAPDLGRTMLMARKATTLSAVQAELFSRRCFDAFRASGSWSQQDLCVVFDYAYIYWNGNAVPSAALTSYFQDGVTRVRHLRALAGSNGDPSLRLSSLRELTYRALLAKVAAEAAVPDEPAKKGVALSRHDEIHPR